MSLTAKQKKEIEKIICDSLRTKFKNYKPETKYMPFHHGLLGKDRMALFSFIHGLNTTFGTSIFEPVAEKLAKISHGNATKQYTLDKKISESAQNKITEIISDLTVAKNETSKDKEVEQIRKVATGGKMKDIKSSKVDLFVEKHDGTIYMFDLKTAKPNAEGFKGHKQKLLEWCAIFFVENPDANIHTLIAMPYNPYHPKPYERWTLKGMFEVEKELMVGDEFWNFLGGDGTYEDLLGCFERAGIGMKKEIDEYFAKFEISDRIAR